MALTLRGVMDRQLTESYDAAVANAQYWQPISDQLSLKWATVARDLRKVRENLFKYNWDGLLDNEQLKDTPAENARRVIDNPHAYVQEAPARLRIDEATPEDFELLVSLFR